MTFQDALKKHFKFKWMPERAVSPFVVHKRLRRREDERSGSHGLADMMRDMKVRKGVEVGTFLGNSAKIWCSANPDLNLTCIDPYKPYGPRPKQASQDERYAVACEAIKDINATLRRETSMDAVSTFKNRSLDFVYIDGDHYFDAAMMDIIRWAPKVRGGGLLAVHDYTSLQGPSVVEAVNAYTRCHNITPWYVTMDYAPTVFWEVGTKEQV